MQSIHYFLTKPKEIIKQTKELPSLKKGEVLLKPLVSGICASDLHYYLGHKDPEKLKERLPLVLLHEGVGEIIKTQKNSKFKKGEKVLIIPLFPCGKCPACRIKEYNLCFQAKFMASTSPGLARIPFSYPENLLLKISENIPIEIVALSEPLSICFRAVCEAKPQGKDKIAVIGDGPMGFFVTLLLSIFSKVSRKNLYFIGMFDEKLKLVSQVAQILNITKKEDQKKLKNLEGNLNMSFECVGGKAMPKTLSLAIDLLQPKGRVVILGITDDLIPIKTIKIVNWGLTILGSSRSRLEDYQKVVALMKDKKMQKLLLKIINKKRFYIKNATDLIQAFDYASDMSHLGRIMVYF